MAPLAILMIFSVCGSILVWSIRRKINAANNGGAVLSNRCQRGHYCLHCCGVEAGSGCKNVDLKSSMFQFSSPYLHKCYEYHMIPLNYHPA